MRFCLDGKGQQAVYWEVGNGAWKIAWIQDRSADSDRDWAGTGLYLNVVRATGYQSGPSGNATDFPIDRHLHHLSHKQILANFVTAVSICTGHEIRSDAL